MKPLNLFYLFLFLFVTAVSCKKKESCPVPDNITKIAGTWVGKYSTVDGAPPTVNQVWEIKADGEIIVHDGFTTPTAPDANKAKGTWTLTGTKFRATYKFITLDLNRYIDATLTDNFTKMNGTRGQNGTYTGNGNIDMTKQ
jgi:hypothetical protein